MDKLPCSGLYDSVWFRRFCRSIMKRMNVLQSAQTEYTFLEHRWSYLKLLFMLGTTWPLAAPSKKGFVSSMKRATAEWLGKGWRVEWMKKLPFKNIPMFCSLWDSCCPMGLFKFPIRSTARGNNIGLKLFPQVFVHSGLNKGNDEVYIVTAIVSIATGWRVFLEPSLNCAVYLTQDTSIAFKKVLTSWCCPPLALVFLAGLLGNHWPSYICSFVCLFCFLLVQAFSVWLFIPVRTCLEVSCSFWFWSNRTQHSRHKKNIRVGLNRTWTIRFIKKD